MLDVIKMVLGSIHDLPLPLRHGFVLLFFTSALLFAVTFKRWLEARRTTKDADLWAHTPVGMTVAQVLMWVVWTTGAIYAVYDAAPKIAAAPAPPTPHHAAAATVSAKMAGLAHVAVAAVQPAPAPAPLALPAVHQPPVTPSATPPATHASSATHASPTTHSSPSTHASSGAHHKHASPPPTL